MRTSPGTMSLSPASLPVRKVFACLALAAIQLTQHASSAAEPSMLTWTGTSGTDFETPDNWDPSGPPENNDFSTVANFSENGPANKTPKLSISRSIHKLDFVDTAGWEIGGDKQLTLKLLSSSGNGTNTISATLKTGPGDFDWVVESGNTVKLAGLIQDGTERTLALTGGGTLVVAGGIRVAYDAAINAFRIDDGVLQIDTPTPYRSGSSTNGSTVTIGSSTAILRLKTTPAGAQGQIGTGIVDGTGRGLRVSDAGGGYAQIMANP